MAIEQREKILQYLFVFAVLVLAFAVFQSAQKGTQVVVQYPQPVPQQQQQPTVTQPKLVNVATLLVFAIDLEANPVAGTVELWRVTNLSEVTKRAFYSTEGYSLWMTKTIDELGVAQFDISRAQYEVINKMIQEGRIKLFAVVIPSGNYYREGVEVPRISFVEGQEVNTLTVQVKPIAQYIDLVNPVLDIRGLSSGAERTRDFRILTISENEKGVLRLYKLEVEPAELSRLTNFIKELTITYGDKVVELIKDGSVKLEGTEEIVFPVRELKANDGISIRVKLVLSNAPDAAADGAEVAKVKIYDVRDQKVGEVSITLDTA
ncbi:MAG: hypothetical protein QW714_00095 [Nanopusillaceae archaeon]